MSSAYHNTDYNNYLRKAMENEANLSEPNYVGDKAPKSIREMMEIDPPIDLLDLERAFQQIMQDIRTKIDAACVVAQEKGCGVKVTKHIGKGTMTIEVTDKIPAGEIHYFDDFGYEGEFEPL